MRKQYLRLVYTMWTCNFEDEILLRGVELSHPKSGKQETGQPNGQVDQRPRALELSAERRARIGFVNGRVWEQPRALAATARKCGQTERQRPSACESCEVARSLSAAVLRGIARDKGNARVMFRPRPLHLFCPNKKVISLRDRK